MINWMLSINETLSPFSKRRGTTSLYEARLSSSTFTYVTYLGHIDQMAETVRQPSYLL